MGRREHTENEKQERRQATMKLFKLAVRLERTLFGGTLTAARCRLEQRLYVGGKHDGKTWQRYELGQRNASEPLIKRVSREIYRLEYAESDKNNKGKKNPNPPSGVYTNIWYCGDKEKNNLVDALRTAHKHSYPMPKGLEKLKQALYDAVYDEELSDAIDNGLREHRYHYVVAHELLELLRDVVGHDIVHEITEAERYSDAYDEPEPDEF